MNKVSHIEDAHGNVLMTDGTEDQNGSYPACVAAVSQDFDTEKEEEEQEEDDESKEDDDDSEYKGDESDAEEAHWVDQKQQEQQEKMRLSQTLDRRREKVKEKEKSNMVAPKITKTRKPKETATKEEIEAWKNLSIQCLTSKETMEVSTAYFVLLNALHGKTPYERIMVYFFVVCSLHQCHCFRFVTAGHKEDVTMTDKGIHDLMYTVPHWPSKMNSFTRTIMLQSYKALLDYHNTHKEKVRALHLKGWEADNPHNKDPFVINEFMNESTYVTAINKARKILWELWNAHPDSHQKDTRSYILQFVVNNLQDCQTMKAFQDKVKAGVNCFLNEAKQKQGQTPINQIFPKKAPPKRPPVDKPNKK